MIMANRLFSLTPGRYYIGARLNDLTRRSVPLGFYPPGRMLASDRVESPVVTRRTLPTGEVVEETYQIVYFGGGTNPELASPIDVGMGATVSGVDIALGTGRFLRAIFAERFCQCEYRISAGTRVVAFRQHMHPTCCSCWLMDSKGALILLSGTRKYYLTALVQADPNIRTTRLPTAVRRAVDRGG
jgi:hypothetical protein